MVLVYGDVEIASWPLPERGRPDLAVVDELAQLQLAARRLGCSVLLRDARVELVELLDLVGLSEAVVALRQESGETEGGEQVSVEELGRLPAQHLAQDQHRSLEPQLTRNASGSG